MEPSVSNHFQYLLPSRIKRFTTNGKQTLTLVEKLLITKAIYQLNKYNKAWLNTNLDKTQTSSRNCLKYSEKRMALIHGNFLPSLAFILFACKNVAFYAKQDFSRA